MLDWCDNFDNNNNCLFNTTIMEKSKNETKEFVMYMWNVLGDMIKNDKCSSENMDKIADFISKDLNVTISRKEACKKYNISEEKFDRDINRKLPSEHKSWTKLYNFNAIFKIFGK